MLAKIAVLFAVVCIAITSAKVCFPDQYQGRIISKTGQVYNGSALVSTASGMEYVDFKKKMAATWEEVQMVDKTRLMGLVYDLKKMKTYQIYPEEKSCNAYSAQESIYKQYCDGDQDFKLMETLTIGGKLAGIYQITLQKQTWEITLMRDDFSRISSVVQTTLYKIPQMIAYQYANYSTNITDDGVFDVPSYCSSDVENSGDSDQSSIFDIIRKMNETDSRPQSRVCAPEQYEIVGYGKLGQAPSNIAMALPLSMKQSLDYKSEMERIEMNVMYNGSLIRNVAIINYNKGKLYSTDPDKKTCEVSAPPTDKMIERCTDNPEMTHLYGFPVNGQMADMYSMTVKDKQKVTFSVFRNTFEPIATLIEETYVQSNPQIIALQSGNMTAGIADPSVFHIPDYCNQ